jgi:hypothetical protein
MPHELGTPEQPGDCAPALPVPAVAAANVENFFDNLLAPQCGHFVPSQFLERTRISLSRSHFSQWNS